MFTSGSCMIHHDVAPSCYSGDQLETKHKSVPLLMSLLEWIESCAVVCNLNFRYYLKFYVHFTHNMAKQLYKYSTRYSVISAVVWMCGKLWISALKLEPHDKCNCLKSSISHFWRHSLSNMHTCRHTSTLPWVWAYINTHHTCHMHKNTQSLRAILHSSNRPVNLSQGAPVCDSVTVCMRECECMCAHACMWAALAMSQSEEERVREREIRTEREERADRPGKRDDERIRRKVEREKGWKYTEAESRGEVSDDMLR